MPTLEELQGDPSFMSASPNDQIRFLSETDPSFKSAHPKEQAEFLAHITKQPTGAEPYAPAKDYKSAVENASNYWEHVGDVPAGDEAADKFTKQMQMRPEEPAPTKPLTNLGYIGNRLGENLSHSGTSIAGTLGRLGTMGAAIPGQIYHAFSDAPKDEEERLAASGLLGPVDLAIRRLVADPSVALLGETRAKEAADEAAGMPHSGLEKLASRVGNIPIVGPFIESVGERAGRGDILGAVGDIAAQERAAKLVKNAPKEFPTAEAGVRKLGTGIRVVGEAAPEIGATAGGIAGALKGDPARAYFEMKGGHYAGKILGKPLASLGKKMEGVGHTLEEQKVAGLEKDFKTAKNAADLARFEYDKHSAGQEAGLPAPKPVIDAYQKTQSHLQLITEHLRLAREAAEAAKVAKIDAAKNAEAGAPITPEAVDAARPTPTNEELAARQEKLMSDIEKGVGIEKPAPAAENVKLPGQVQPETFPQEPTEAPKVEETTRMRPLAGGKGMVMGRKPFQLTEGVPAEPKPPLGEILPPEKPAKGRLGTLRVAEGGKVIDTEPTLQAKIEEGLQGRVKPVAIPPAGNLEIEDKPTPEQKPIEDALTAYEARQEPLTKPHEKELKAEGMSPEDMSKVEKIISQHTDQDLIRLGKKYGLDESKYDFNKREGESRHRVERDQMVKDILAKLPEKDTANIARLSDEFDSKDESTWTEAERSKLSKAQRARAIMQEHEGGAAAVAGGTSEEVTTPSGEKVKYLTGKDAEEAATRNIVEAGGGKYRGVQEGVPEANLKDLVLFDHPETKSTLALPKDQVTPEAVKARLESHKEAWDKAKDEAVAKEHNENQGSSILKEGKATDGYSVGINKDLEKTLNKEHIDADDVKEYRERPEVQKALKDNPDAFIGTWVDGRKTYLDTSVHVSDLEAAKKLGIENSQKAIFDVKKKESIALEERKYPEGYPESAKEGGEGELPPVSGGKHLPTDDELIKKYGESNGDPAHTVFITEDGRGVANTGVDHDQMLGGKATDRVPPRELYVQSGRIRVRPRSGGKGGREVAMSIPPKGVNDAQLAYIKKMSPQLRSGAVLIENGERGGDYRVLEYGKATDEALEQVIKELGPKNKTYKDMTPAEQETAAAKGVSGGAPELPAIAEKHLTPEERAGVTKSAKGTKEFIPEEFEAGKSDVKVSPLSERPNKIILSIKVDGERAGQLSLTPMPELDKNAWEVSTSKLGEAYRGKGHGTEMYKQAIDYAKNKGVKTLFSDDKVSTKANNVWQSLVRDGEAKWDEATQRYKLDVSPLGKLKYPKGYPEGAKVGGKGELPEVSGGIQSAVSEEKENAPTFYSKAERVAADKLTNNSSGEQMLATLKNNGVKPEELEHMGMEEFLKDKTKVSKADVLEHIKKNQIKLGETTLGDSSKEYDDARDRQVNLHRDITHMRSSLSERMNEMGARSVKGQLHFGEAQGTPWTQPKIWGEDNRPFTMQLWNAQELPKEKSKLLELIPDTDEGKAIKEDFKKYEDLRREYHNVSSVLESMDEPEDTQYSSHVLDGKKENYREKLITFPSAEEFSAPHFSNSKARNIMAHTRYDDRIDTDGKKNLFIEEVQSDWHQKGKKEGYNFGRRWFVRDRSLERTLLGTFDSEQKANNFAWEHRDKDMQVQHVDSTSKIPDAPFKSDWHELVMKRMLREAAEKGVDRLSWTTGDQQAERYDLSRHISRVQWNPKEHELSTWDKDGDRTIFGESVEPEELENYVGKDIAKELIAQGEDYTAVVESDFNIDLDEDGEFAIYREGHDEPMATGMTLREANRFVSAQVEEENAHNSIPEISGLDLKTGGEWAQALYDRAIPNFMNKYLKKFGVKVEDRHMRINTDIIGGHYIGETRKIHSIEITPEMRKHLLKEGQPIAENETTPLGEKEAVA